MTMPLLLAFGPGDWPTDPAKLSGSPRYHLWGLARRGWHVVYVEPPKRFRLFAEQRDVVLPHGSRGRLEVITLDLVPPFAVRFAPMGALGEKWRCFTAARLAKGVEPFLAVPPRVVWLGAPWHAPIAEHFAGRARVVHHVYDELSLSPIYSPAQSARLRAWEEHLVRLSDLVLCSSAAQFALRAEHSERAILLENAVRDDFLNLEATAQQAERLRRIESLPGPRIVYGGVADQRLDPQVLTSLVKGLDDAKQGSLIFAGTKSPRLDRSIAGLANHPRVFFTGTMAYADYPSLYRVADVLILTHRRTPFTDAMYPEKLNEYLMVGKPVVSVPLPEARRISDELPPNAIRLVTEPAGFAAACLEAAKRDTADLREARRQWAAQHTWDRTSDRLVRYMGDLLREDGTRG